MARPRPIIETTGETNELTSVNSVATRTMPQAPITVRPPTISGSAAATTPPKMKNSSTATAGMARISIRFWSAAMVSFSVPATACRPATCTSTPGIAKASFTFRKLRTISVSLSPWMATEAKVYFLSFEPNINGDAGPVSVCQ